MSKVAVLVLLLGLVHESVQDYKWKIYKFNRHQQDPVMVSGFGGPSNTRNAEVVVPNAQAETLISGIGFDCSNRPTGPNRDPRYCDLFHACVFGKQVKTYGCSQAGGLSYYDEHLQRCEFTSRNPSGCSNNQYYQASIHFQAHQAASGYGMTAAPVTNPTTNGNWNPYQPAQSTAAPATYVPLTNPPQTQTPQTLVPITYPPVTYVPQTTTGAATYPTNTGYNPYNPNTMSSAMTSQPYYTNQGGNNGQTTTQAVEAWRAYVRANEQFTCSGRSDGFYASRWCNVFYRCYQGYKFEFLCAAMTSGDRLWWSQHSTSNTLPQATAQCAFPCDTKRQCTSPGGVLKDNGSPVTESTSDAQRLYSACTATTTSSSQNNQGNSLDDLFVLPDQYSVCQGVADGTFVASPKYCNIFHVCINGQRKDFECAKASNSYDLWWNDATKQCDWPCKVSCSKSLYGSSSSAAQIQAQDNSVNSAICQGSGTGTGTGTGGYGTGSGSYGGYQTTQSYPSYPTNPTTQQTAYPTAYPTVYTTTTPATTTQSVNNNYNNNNNFFTIPAAMYGK